MVVLPDEQGEGSAVITDDTNNNFNNDLRLIEALLFASGVPVTVKMISERLGSQVDVLSLLQILKSKYAGHGVELIQSGERWLFRTCPDLSDKLKLEKVTPRKLSRAGTETLAIIAYHQPVTRAEIEEIRGVIISKGTIDILLEQGWIKPKGRRQTPGRPMTWGTSDAFLDHFGLSSLLDLPGLDELKASGLLDTNKGASIYNARAMDEQSILDIIDSVDEPADNLDGT